MSEVYVAAVSEMMIRLSDHETVVTDSGGEKTPMLLVHALSMDHRFWTDVAVRLVKNYRVITYDIRGFGAAHEAPTCTLTHFASDARDLLNELRIDRAIVVGLSLGGLIAQLFAIEYPHRVLQLGIVASTAWSHPAMALRADAAERDGMAAQVTSNLARWFTADSISNNTAGVRYARERVERVSVRSWAMTWRLLANMTVAERLSSIKSPTFLIAGADDPSTPVEIMQKLTAAIHGATLQIIPNTSHMIALEKPDELADAIQRGIITANHNE